MLEHVGLANFLGINISVEQDGESGTWNVDARANELVGTYLEKAAPHGALCAGWLYSHNNSDRFARVV